VVSDGSSDTTAGCEIEACAGRMLPTATATEHSANAHAAARLKVVNVEAAPACSGSCRKKPTPRHVRRLLLAVIFLARGRQRSRQVRVVTNLTVSVTAGWVSEVAVTVRANEALAGAAALAVTTARMV